MEGWLVAAAASVTAIAGLIAAGGAIWLGYLNRQLVRASQDEVQASLGVIRVSQEQMARQERPVLVPLGKPTFQSDHDNWLSWGEANQPLVLCNLGTGTAFNVASVLYGCASYQHDSPAGITRDPTTADMHWTCWLGVPIAPNEQAEGHYAAGASVYLAGNDRIANYTFNAPDEELPRTTPNPDALWKVARVTTTYHDISGRKFASIFDYVHNRGWYKVAILPDITHDLYDLEGYNREIVDQSAPADVAEG